MDTGGSNLSSEKAKAIGMVIIIIFIIVSILMASLGFGAETQEVPIEPAPKFTGYDIDDNKISLQDYEGKVVILYFLYLAEETCSHCRLLNEEQIKELQKVYDEYPRERVEIIAIDMTYYPTNDQVENERDRYNIEWPMINDVFVGSHTDRHFDQTEFGGKYVKYLLDARGTLINPTILLLNLELEIVGVYHIGIVTPTFDFDATSLNEEDYRNILTVEEFDEKIERLESGTWGATVEGKIFAGVSLTTMFLLGVFVSITPCALALLISMTAYVASINEKKKKESLENEDKSKSGPDGLFQDSGPIMMTAEASKKSSSGIESEAWSGASIGLAFTLGIGLIFFIIGCLFSYIGGVFITYADVFYIIAGTILIVFGVHNIIGLGVIYSKLKTKSLTVDKLDTSGTSKPGLFERGRLFGLKLVHKYVLFGAFFLGMLLALGWAPCALAFVIPALVLVMTQGLPVLVGGLYLFVFSLGYGVPIILFATLTTTVKGRLANKFSSVSKWIPKVFGVVIIILGILMIIRIYGFILW
jgi:cytochrome c-type biogenesis protein